MPIKPGGWGRCRSRAGGDWEALAGANRRSRRGGRGGYRALEEALEVDEVLVLALLLQAVPVPRGGHPPYERNVSEGGLCPPRARPGGGGSRVCG